MKKKKKSFPATVRVQHYTTNATDENNNAVVVVVPKTMSIEKLVLRTINKPVYIINYHFYCYKMYAAQLEVYVIHDVCNIIKYNIIYASYRFIFKIVV